MKKTLFVAFLSLIVATFSLKAQDNSVLWKVSGNGLKKDSYVLGTLHIMCEDEYLLKDKIKNIIPKVDVVTFEVNLASPENQAVLPEMMKPDTSFFSKLSPTEIKEIDSILTKNSLSIKMFDMMSPAVFVSILSLKSMNCTDPTKVKMMESDLQELAKSQNKGIDDLETLKFQMDLLNNLFNAQDLLKYLRKMDEMPATSKKMVDAYKAENLAELESVLYDNSYMSKAEQEDFLVKRNQNWMNKIPAKIQEKSHLFAVGAGHLVGEHGIIKLLKEKGYTLTPIL